MQQPGSRHIAGPISAGGERGHWEPAHWHSHEGHVLHWLKADMERAMVGDWLGRLPAGHWVLTGPRLPHRWAPPHGAGTLESVRSVALEWPGGGGPEPVRLPHGGQCAQGILQLAQHGVLLRAAASGDTVLPNRAALAVAMPARPSLEWLAFCRPVRTLSRLPMQSPGSENQRAQIHAVLEHLARHVGESISARHMAQTLGMHESGFSRFFRQSTGVTFTSFVNRQRVSRACQLLQESRLQITDIGYAVGFNNIANFNRRFLSIQGMTPRDYRRHAGGMGV